MKYVLLTLCCAVSLSTFSQVTYLADTAFYTDIGFGGAEASCKTAHIVYNGWNMTRSQHQWVADVFTVPAGGKLPAGIYYYKLSARTGTESRQMILAR